MTVKDAFKYALAGCTTPSEIKKFADNDITPDEITALKNAGYTKEEMFKLMEMVETSPTLQEAAPEKLEEAKHIDDTKDVDEVPEIKTGDDKPSMPSAEETLDKLFD